MTPSRRQTAPAAFAERRRARTCRGGYHPPAGLRPPRLLRAHYRPRLQNTCHPERSVSGVEGSSGRKGKRPDPPRLKMRGVPDCGAPIALQRQKGMSFRAAKRRGIFPIAVVFRPVPALEKNDAIPQPARPFDYAQGDRFYLALARTRPCGRMLSAPTGLRPPRSPLTPRAQKSRPSGRLFSQSFTCRVSGGAGRSAGRRPR